MSRAYPWRSAGRTAQGKSRSRNEDAFLDCPQRGCWAVADGMGGHHAGDVASQRIVSGLAALPGQGALDQRIDAARRCLHGLDSHLQHADGVAGVMGSTVVVLLLEHDRAACLWAGDSRCYLWRGQRLYQLSRDHSLQQHLMDKQQLSPELAQAHPGARALTRAVGARQPLSLEILELRVQTGDVFLLCSDGLYQGLSHRELGGAMGAGTPRQAVEQLFNAALRGPARDDLTALVIQP
ncbi:MULTISPECIES: PP2C family protein-serine/threonine phosphatase [Pseudomonas]|uniref:Serine/threonine-protein phosphatase n=1 Tax=Pseudomonas azadiae TaxID=2843612 RepID=A0ABS6P4G0_9PSED|nr:MULTISPECIES: PP2C family serine/threonine-protein phosphatase [Pseudomonas]MBV4455341.1 serine/threonine-protein phosphatase [Pseudomonas azadiae]NMF43660.1 serine/threonine-protein phosphatase [Pseudomonas sp. SWRI 103]